MLMLHILLNRVVYSLLNNLIISLSRLIFCVILIFLAFLMMYNLYDRLQDKLLDQTSVSHLFPITKYIGLLATGMTGRMQSDASY